MLACTAAYAAEPYGLTCEYQIDPLGYYEASLNSKPVNDNELYTGWTRYGKQILYSVLDNIEALRMNADLPRNRKRQTDGRQRKHTLFEERKKPAGLRSAVEEIRFYNI
jgi:hypothetical protein